MSDERDMSMLRDTSANEMRELKQKNHVVWVHPRDKTVSIDGLNRYTIRGKVDWAKLAKEFNAKGI
jgi:hypothetical protein